MENAMKMNGNVSFLPLSNQREKKERLDRLFVRAPGKEDVTRREECVKHFDLGANRHQAVVYPNSIHYREDNQGEWKEIDNTLKEVVTAHGRHVLRNHAGRVKMEFPMEMDSGDMASVTCDGNTFAWRFEEKAQPIRAKVRNGVQLKQERLVKMAQKLPKFVGRTVESLQNDDLSAEVESEQERRADIVTLKAETAYENVLPGVSVRYQLNGSALKEDIIMANKEALAHTAIRLPGDYDYTISSKNELFVLDKKTGNQLFSMNAPLVYDAQGKQIIADVMLTNCGNYTRMEYSIDEEFMNNAVYPVTIDPVVNSYSALNNIKDTTLGEGRDYGYPDETYMMVGKYNSSVNCVALLRFNQLALLTASDTVISAVLNIAPKNSSDSKYIGAYEVLKPWDVDTVGWKNFDPTDSSNISVDAVDCLPGSSSSWLGFDLTNLYRKWCTKQPDGTSNNNGVAFRTPDNISGANYSELYSANAASGYQPVMYVNYISHAGMEDWWQYEQMAAGRAGTAYADLFNGNLVFEHTDTVMTGNRMPVSINHYYNSCLSDKNEYHCGFGWKTSSHQKIETREHNDRDYYVWVDGDGTEHFFEKTGSQPYEDSEGMELKLTYNNSDSANRYFILEDKGHNQMRFKVVQDQLAWLVWAKDACGNTVNYSYVSGYEVDGRIDTITDPAGRVTKYNYSGDLLASIQIPDSAANTYRYVYFTYDGSQRLTGVRYSDLGGTAAHTTYTYDGSTCMLTKARNYDGVQVNVGYEASSLYDPTTIAGGVTAQMRRVLSMECLVTNASGTTVKQGAKQLFEYKHMCTEVTAVETASSDAGKKLYYQFNDSGNVVSVRDDLGYARFTKFESGIENRPSEQSPIRKAVINLLRSPDFAANWEANTANSTGTITKDTTVTCMGAPAMKFVPTTVGMEYRQEVTLKADTVYVFSAYVKTQDCAEEEAAYISIEKKNNSMDGSVSTPVFGTTEAAIGNELPTDGWERVHAVYYHSASVDEAFYVKFKHGAVGTAWFACPQLEEGSIVNPVNLVSNGDFRYTYTSGSQTMAREWTAGPNNLTTAASSVFAASTDATFPEALTGNYIQVEGRPDKNGVGYVQQFDLRGSAGDVFVVGGWANAKSVPNATTSGRGFGIAMRLKKKSDGQWIDYYMMPFNEEWVGWQFGSWALVAAYDYTAIDMTLIYTRNCGNAKFSNIFMYREQFGQSYEYDDDKNVVSTGTLSGQKSDITYDDADNVQEYTQPGRAKNVDDNKYLFYYGSSTAQRKKHLLQRSRTPMHVTDYFSYDDYGNVLSSRRVDYDVYTTGAAETAYPYIRTENTYDESGNFIATSKDARGNVVTRVVDPKTGTLTSVTDPNNQTVNYTYDASQRVTGVQTTADGKTYRNSYTYENDRIKTVSHNTTSDTANDVTYTLEYDSLGRKTDVKVGTQVLSTNVYEADRNGLLSEVQYGNGGKVHYEYDEFDRLKGIEYDDEGFNRYTYQYGANGLAAEVQDENMGIICRTEYDLSDRPCHTEKIDGENLLVQRTDLKYDKLGNLAHFTEELRNGEIHRSSYTYDRDNRITEIEYDNASDQKVAYTYDNLGRVVSRVVTSGTNVQTTTYEYVDGGYGTNSTTPLVKSITQPGICFDYAYDNRGNIISEKHYAPGTAEANKLETTYVYDGLGQLIRVNDPHENATWIYSYDRGGNILNKTKYAFTTGALGSVVEDIPYTYGDSNWKDKLTAYNGVGITYDEIANPLFDGERTYTWGAGRQLRHISMPASGSNGSDGKTKEIDFIYDHNGMRTGKIVSENGKVEITEYTLHGKLITHLTKRVVDMGDVETVEELHFFYDAQSRPAIVEYNGEMYSYRHNLQGDIIGIVDTEENLVIEYKYDVWGKPIYEAGNLLSTLGNLNPFRYRGYAWDVETELYYLRSRYYSPEICRFLNCDIALGVNDDMATNNLFVYCGNNSIVFSDHTGRKSEWEVLGFKYDGTASDFRRLEQGLPPLAYSNWLKNGGTISLNKVVWRNSYGVTLTAEKAVYLPKNQLDIEFDKTEIDELEFDLGGWAEYLGGFVVEIPKIKTVVSALGLNIYGRAYTGLRLAGSLVERSREIRMNEALKGGTGILIITWNAYTPGLSTWRYDTYMSWDGTTGVSSLFSAYNGGNG